MHFFSSMKIIAALKADLRSTDLIAGSEVDSSIKEAAAAIKNLPEWSKPEEKSVPLMHKPGSGFIVKEPYGLVLIISPVPSPFSWPPHTHTARTHHRTH
jgi:aldehyde dehydrogenase (NAD+)